MKRSAQVGLVLMTAVGVGGTSYALMPGRDCVPANDAAAQAPLAPGVAPKPACAPRGSSGSGGYHWYSGHGSGWGGWGSSGPSSTAAGLVSRGGFGATGRGMAAGS